MKALKKALLACATVGALSAVVATSAFAATYDKDTGKVSTEKDLSTYTGQMTVLVIEKGADEKEGGIVAEDILYIDQTEAAAGIFQGMGVKGGSLANGTYVVKIGGENVDAILTEEFTVGGTKIIQLGECDGEKAAVDVGDALAILKHSAGTELLTGDNLIAAECDGEKAAVDVGDALAVLKHSAGTEVLGTIEVPVE